MLPFAVILVFIPALFGLEDTQSYIWTKERMEEAILDDMGECNSNIPLFVRETLGFDLQNEYKISELKELVKLLKSLPEPEDISVDKMFEKMGDEATIKEIIVVFRNISTDPNVKLVVDHLAAFFLKGFFVQAELYHRVAFDIMQELGRSYVSQGQFSHLSKSEIREEFEKVYKIRSEFEDFWLKIGDKTIPDLFHSNELVKNSTAFPSKEANDAVESAGKLWAKSCNLFPSKEEEESTAAFPVPPVFLIK